MFWDSWLFGLEVSLVVVDGNVHEQNNKSTSITGNVYTFISLAYSI